MIVDIATPDGPMCAILVARPPGIGPLPAVITYPHVGGLTNTMRTMAERVAEGGYVSLVIDLYHRIGTIVIDPESTNENVVAIRKIAAASVTDANAMRDTGAALAWLDAQPFVRGPSVGTIGYGRGGGRAGPAAAEFPKRVRAAASVLGFGFTNDGVPACRDRLARIQGGLYCAFAEHDDIISETVPNELSASLAGLPLDAQLVVHPGTRHPYVFPDRAVHDPAAAAARLAGDLRHLRPASRRSRIEWTSASTATSRSSPAPAVASARRPQKCWPPKVPGSSSGTATSNPPRPSPRPLPAAGGAAMAVAGSVTEAADVEAIRSAVLAHFGSVKILVNNAGFAHIAPAIATTDQQWTDVVEVHMGGAFRCVRAFAPAMIAQSYGRIINISSLSVLGADRMAAYAAAKAGLLGLTRALMVELGPHNITVNAILPGYIRTERIKRSPAFPVLDEHSRRAQTLPAEGQPEDVANAVLFYASARSRFVTGDCMAVTGGMYQLW